MQIKQEKLTPTSIKLTVTADQSALQELLDITLKELGQNIKIAGFRAGKAPTKLIEKEIDPATLQNEFLNKAITQLYSQSIKKEGLRVVSEPEVTISKFVPFSTLEFSANLDVIGEIKLVDYKTIKVTPKIVKISAKDVDAVVENLRSRVAEKVTVKRVIKDDDEAVIDFSGVDAKTKGIIEGAEGKDYPLVIGSKSFIPGFEEELVGMKTDQEKTFTITFPKDYKNVSLQNRKVSFTVKVKEVKELRKPKVDSEFLAKLGPFKDLDDLKKDIKKQLQVEKETEANQILENELLLDLAKKSDIPIPKSLIDQEIKRIEDDEKRSIIYRGQTWQEHLTEEGVSEEEHGERQRPLAHDRIKVGLILGLIADKENIKVSESELEERIKNLKTQHQDPAMQAELDKPSGRQDILSRLIIEKTIKYLRNLATAKV